MDNTNYNAKCLKCGYIYEADESESTSKCPLCENTNSTKEAMAGFKEQFKDYFPEKRSRKKVVKDIIVFTAALFAFIILLYFVVSLITTLTNQNVQISNNIPFQQKYYMIEYTYKMKGRILLWHQI